MKLKFRRLLLAASALCAVAVAPDPARADPVSISVGLLVGAGIQVTATTFAVTMFLVNAGIGAAVNLAGKVLFGKSAAAARERQASVITIQTGEVPRELVVGRACTAGSLLDGFNWGGKHGTDWECLVIAIADHPIDALEGFYAWDTYYAFGGNGLQSGFNNGLDIELVNATPGGSAPPSRFATPSGWASTDRCAGMTLIWFAYNAELAQDRSGRPTPRFVVRGKRMYDPRKDSTVPGGSGSHRWSNPATWEWTQNARVIRYNWVRGIFAGDQVGSPEHLWLGRGLTATEAPPEREFAAANLCDEAVALRAGGTEARYRCNGVFRSDEEFDATEEMFAAAMAGVVIQREGGVEVEPGAAKSAVVEITDADLVVGEKVVFEPFLPDPERVNSVVSRYIEPGQKYNDHAAPIRRSLADIATDGRPREEVLPLALVTSGTQAQRCAEIQRRLARLERRATITLGPRFARLEEGDWIGWTSARYLGGARVVFRIERYGRQANWRKTLALREITGAAFDWVAANDEIIPGVPLPPAHTTPGALDLDGVVITGVMRGGVPGVRISWDTPVDPAITGVRADIRVLGQTQEASTSTNRPAAGVLEATNGVASGESIQVRVTPVGPRGRAVTATPWTTLTAQQLIAGVAIVAGSIAVDNTAPTTGQPPSFYRAKGPGLYPERKTRASLGIAGSGTQYGTLRTDVPSSNTSEVITQSIVILGVTWKRSSVSEAAWGTWQKAFSQAAPPTWSDDIPDRPVELTDGRLAAGFDSFGDLARNILTARANSSSLLRRTAGGLFTGELTADETAFHSAAGVTGAGSGLWANNLTQLNATEGTKLAGVAANATRNTGLLADKNTVGTADIAFGAVLPSRVNIGDTSNLFPDPRMIDVDAWTPYASGHGSAWIFQPTLTGDYTSAQRLRINASAGNVSIISPPMEVEPGKTYLAAFGAQASNALQAGWDVYARFSTLINGVLTYVSLTVLEASASPAPTSRAAYDRQFTVPAGVNCVQMQFRRRGDAGAGIIWFDSPVLRRAASTEVIVPRAVNTDRIANKATEDGAFSYTEATTNLPATPGSWLAMQSTVVTVPSPATGDDAPTIEAAVEMSFDWLASGVPADGFYDFWFRLLRNGTPLVGKIMATSSLSRAAGGISRLRDTRSLTFTDTPSPGATHTYSVEAMWTVGDPGLGVHPTPTAPNRLVSHRYLRIRVNKGK